MILLLAFANMAALDLAWVGYNRSTARDRKAWAVIWAMILAGLSGINAIAVVGDPWNLIGTVLGAAAGTLGGMYLAPWLESRGKPKGIPAQIDPSLALELACHDARAEVLRAKAMFPGAMNSMHEGYAVALEEVDELKAHVRRKQKDRDLDAARTEAIQAAAMFLRFASECCDEKTGRV